MPVVIILDNIRSLNNIGSVFRTADAFRVEKICLCGITGQPPHREIQKTALGATESVDWEYFEHSVDAVVKIKNAGYRIIAVEQMANSTQLHQFHHQKNKKIALIFGNEVNGVSVRIAIIFQELTIVFCDVLVIGIHADCLFQIFHNSIVIACSCANNCLQIINFCGFLSTIQC